MITFELNEDNAVLEVRPTGPLKKEDFERLAQTVDPYIEKEGGLVGMMIASEHFPGWESLGAMVQHFQFVRNHHAKIERIALVTDSKLGDIAEKLGAHFSSATIKHFPAGETKAAKTWLEISSTTSFA